MVVNDDVYEAVLLTFFFNFRMCLFTVGMDLGRCLRTVAESSPGNVVNYPLSMAFVHVSMVGLHDARCRYFTRYFWGSSV